MLVSTHQVRDVMIQRDDDDHAKLTAIRGYRVQLLHFIGQNHVSPDASEEMSLLMRAMAGLYETLLHCSLLSINISRNLKRATFLCIETLGTVILSHDNTSVIHKIHTQLIEHLLFPDRSTDAGELVGFQGSNENNCTPDNPESLVHSIQEVLLYTATRDIFLSNSDYILQALRLVCQMASKHHVRENLAVKPKPLQENPEIAQPWDYESDWIIMGKTVELAVKLCNILKSIFSPIVSDIFRSNSAEINTTVLVTVKGLQQVILYLIHDLILPTLMCQTASTSESLSVSGIVLIQALSVLWHLILTSSLNNIELQVNSSNMKIDSYLPFLFTASFFAKITLLDHPTVTQADIDETTPSCTLTKQVQELMLNSKQSQNKQEIESSTRSDIMLSFHSSLHQFSSLFGLSHESLLTYHDDLERIWYPLFGNPLPAIQRIAIARGMLVWDEFILFYSLPRTTVQPPSTVEWADDNHSSLTCLWMYPIGSNLLHFARNSIDNGVRLSAVKGLSSILGRLKDRIQRLSTKGLPDSPTLREGIFFQGLNIDHHGRLLQRSSSPDTIIKHIHEFLTSCLDVCFSAWESQACRQVIYAVPDLFKSVLDITDCVEKYISILGVLNHGKNNSLSLEMLTEYILSQPVHRKGRYVALELLLPRLGASKLMMLSDYQKKNKSQAARGIFSPPQQTFIMKDRVDAGLNDITPMNSVQPYVSLKLTSANLTNSVQSTEIQSKPTLISSLINGVCEGGNNSRAACDLLVKILSSLKTEMHDKGSVKLDDLVHENRKQRRKREDRAKKGNASLSKINTASSSSDESSPSSLLPSWMKLWIGPTAAAMLQQNKLYRSQISSLFLPQISSLIGRSMHRVDVCHIFSCLLDELVEQARMLQSIVHHPLSEELLLAKLEMCIHAANQCCFKSSPPSLILNQAMRRAIANDIEDALQHYNSEIRLAAFRSLECVIPALHDDIVDLTLCASDSSWNHIEVNYWMRFLPYSIKVADKGYNTRLLERAMLLATRLLSEAPPLFANFLDDFLIKTLFLEKVAYPGTVAAKEEFGLQLIAHISALIYSSDESPKKLSDVQRRAVHQVTLSLLSDDVYCALFNLCHSSWDNARASSFNLLSKMSNMNRRFNIPLPENLKTNSSRLILQIRALHLASSPRQKESDTGAKVLAISTIINESFQHDLLKLLEIRLESMQRSLDSFLCLSGPSQSFMETDSLPLAHGFMLGLRICIESYQQNSALDFSTVAKLCHKAIAMSLVVVADIKDDISTDGSTPHDTQWKTVLSTRVKSQTEQSLLNINTGALGANTSFASVREYSNKRFLTQRVVIGTWLLTKEACATLAAVIKFFPGGPPSSIVDSAGHLLISVLLTLKHQGGAHAAHRALEDICGLCFSDGNTPSQLQIDKANCESMHGSIQSLPIQWAQIILTEISALETIRDSTLRRSTGFALGILSVLKGAPGQLVSDTIKKLLVISDERNDDIRSRTHALNILRMVMSDASLKPTIRTFAGDCLITAFVGYSSIHWAIKNSATMTLSAAVLHFVDSKNSSCFTDQSEVFRGNAITLKDFHVFYPSAFRFIVDKLRLVGSDYKSIEGGNTLLFPILLLIARLQPTSLANIYDGAQSLANILVPHIMYCLKHPHNKIRLIASRALSVLCTEDDELLSSTSRRSLLQGCLTMMRQSPLAWNSIHGSLLAMRRLLSPPNSHIYVNEKMLEMIFYYATWAGYSLNCPPVCVSLALEIWSNLSIPSVCHMSLSSVVFNLCSLINRLTSQRLDSFTLSTTILAVTSSRIAVAHTLHDTFVRNEFDKIDLLEDLLLNGTWDIRLHATKSLKKALRVNLQRFQYSTGTDENTKIIVIWRMTVMLLKSFQGMLSLPNGSSNLHPPTLRRLSRCIIDCLLALKAVNSAICALHIRNYDVEHQLWMLLEITASKKVSEDMNISNDEISGNLIELMSFVLFSQSWSRQENVQFILSPNDARRVKFFETVIDHAMQPHGFWRVRYSVALAIGISSIYTVALAQHTITLLQDEDIDVRAAVINALTHEKEDVTETVDNISSAIGSHDNQVYRSLYGRLQAPSSSLQYVDSSIMEKIYKLITRGFMTDSGEILLLLLRQIKKLRDVEKLIEAVDEYEDYQDAVNKTISRDQLESSLVESSIMNNTGTTRKIFEEEDANPYEELLLETHYAVISIVERFQPSYLDEIEISSHLQVELSTIIDSGELILDILLRHESQSVWLSLSRSNRIFCTMNAGLLGLAMVIFLGLLENDNEKRMKIKDNARHILRRNENNKTDHPQILKLLELLSNADVGSTECKNGLYECCFLSR